MNQQPDDPPPAAPDDDAGAALPLIELETLLARPPSWRKRAAQIGLVLAAFVVVLVTFWGVIVPPAPPRQPVYVAPTPAPRTVSIRSNISYGTLTINGQQQRGAPPLTTTIHGQQPYTITLNAPPFQPRTCQFPPPKSIVPYAFHACDAGQTIFSDQDALTILEIFFTLRDLPAAQQQQIISLLANQLTTRQTITVPAQAHIVTGLKQDGTITSKRFSGPLIASASLVPGTQSSRRGIFCFSSICIGQGGFVGNPPGSGHYWQVQTPIALRWRFTTASGQIVSDITFPADPTLLTLTLAYDAAAGWSIAPPFSSKTWLDHQLNLLFCTTGAQMLAMARARYLSGSDWDVSIARDQGSAGCALALTRQHVDQGQFIWRFGTLLAVDTKAHALMPALPVASPDEIAAVEGA